MSRFGGVLLLVVVLLAAGCLHPGEGAPIPPLPASAGRVDPGLGSGAQPLSSGPGYKGSPSWSPGGDRIAFTVDGYVVDKPVYSGNPRRWTTRDLVAEEAEWTGERGLTILGAAPGSAATTDGASSSVYRARPGRGSLGVEKSLTKVSAMSPAREGLIVALASGSREGRLVRTRDDGVVDRIYTNPFEGSVTSISPSPDGEEVVLAVRPPGDGGGTSELRVLDLGNGDHRRVARLDEGMEIFGAPQWTERGLYYVAGRADPPAAGSASAAGSAAPLYALYRVPVDSGEPEKATGVGEDFAAASIRVSPDGGRLAVIGRLNPKSPANLYVLDVVTGNLEAETTNEDMEIKTGPDDLAWSPDGGSVAIVARGTPSGEPEVRPAATATLLRDFYNLYEVPVEDPEAAMR